MTGVAGPAGTRIFMLAGEPSGDMLGARLIQALRAETGDSLELFGVGGARMREQGLTSLFPMEELSLLGLAGVAADVTVAELGGFKAMNEGRATGA